MDSNFDIITVGGGVAGAAVAAVMARSGSRVLVLERETQFRDRVRGEWLAPWGVAEVRALGLLDAFSAAGAWELPYLAGRTLKPRPVGTPGGDRALTFYHPELQETVLAEAAASGATVCRGASVTAVTRGAPATVTYRVAGGPAITASATLVVGADGRSSLARKALGRESRVHTSARLLAGARLQGLSGDPSVGYFIVREEAGALVSLFPQAGGFGRAYVFQPGADISTYRGEKGFDNFMNALVQLGVPAETLAGATLAGPLAAFVADDSWVERPAGDGIALVGDAAGISDPTWGMGLSLAFRDARTLTEALLSLAPDRALAAYAAERDAYYATVITAENWHTEMQLTPGPIADRRRRHAMRLWKEDPGRSADLPSMGPAVDVSEGARARFFGEDVPMADECPPDPAQALVTAMRDRDFEALKRLFTPNARLRALLPGGPSEFNGPDEAAGAFARWFGHAESFALVDASAGYVSDRLRVRMRSSVRWAGEDFSRLVEQVAYAKVIDGRIAVMDLLCSGFRPAGAEAALAA
jgi:2-polyprenyl-6-methoxyphenol hydroxylase-like FAD-dependent oxidoreductase